MSAHSPHGRYTARSLGSAPHRLAPAQKTPDKALITRREGSSMRSLFLPGHGKTVRLLVSVITALTAFGARPGNAAANTVIDLTYDSVMDMVRPEVHPGIAVHHNLQITVSGGGNLSEGRNRSAGPYQDRNAMTRHMRRGKRQWTAGSCASRLIRKARAR